MGAILYEAMLLDKPQFDYIGLKWERKFDPGNETQEQYRVLLRVVLRSKIKQITSISEVINTIATSDRLSGRFNGSSEPLSLEIGSFSGFPDWRMVSQAFRNVGNPGSKNFQTVQDWTTATDYRVLDWETQNVKAPMDLQADVNTIGEFGDIDIRLETREDPESIYSDSVVEQYRSNSSVNVEWRFSNLIGITNIRDEYVTASKLTHVFPGDTIEQTIETGTGFEKWFLSGAELLPTSAESGGKGILRYTYEASAPADTWNTLWS